MGHPERVPGIDPMLAGLKQPSEAMDHFLPRQPSLLSLNQMLSSPCLCPDLPFNAFHDEWPSSMETYVTHNLQSYIYGATKFSYEIISTVCCECLKIETDVCVSVLHPYSLASCKDTCSVEIWRDLIDSRTTVRSQSASLQPPALPFTVV